MRSRIILAISALAFDLLIMGRARAAKIEPLRPPAVPLPEQIGFVACAEELLPDLTDIVLPVLVLSRRPFPPAGQPAAPDTLGTIYAAT